MQKYKSSIVLSLLLISTGWSLPVHYNELYPWVNVSFVSPIIIVIAIYITSAKRRVIPYLCLIISISVLYRVRVFMFPSSLIGADPDSYALWMAQLIQHGRIDFLPLGFYSDAPTHLLVGSTTALVTGLDTAAVQILFPILSGIIIPLYVLIFSSRIRAASYTTGLLAVGGISVSGYMLDLSYWPIAQTTGVIFSILTILLVFIYVMDADYRWLFIGVMTMFVSIYTHKLSAIITVVIVGGAALFVWIHPQIQNTELTRRLTFSIIPLLSLFVALQIFYLTDLAYRIYGYVIGIRGSTGIATSAYLESSISYTIIDRIYADMLYPILLATLSGFVWILWSIQTLRSSSPLRDVFFIGLSAASAGFVVILYFSPVSLGRIIVQAEPILYVLLAVGLYIISNNFTTEFAALQYLSVLFILFILVSGITPLGAVDYDSDSRLYLTENEVSAKLWGYHNIPQAVAADNYYATELPPSLISSIASGERQRKYIDHSSTFLNNSFSQLHSKPVVIRTCIDVYRSPHTGAGWKLKYRPSVVNDRINSKTYNSGCVSFYT